MKFLIISTILLINLFFYTTLYSQVNADFSVNKTSGCSPLVVQFTDQSAGAVNSYQWNFGNGNSSTDQNPGASYVVPGTYTITLTVSDGSNSDTETKTHLITVFANPTAGFSTANNHTGCVPLSVDFINQSIEGDTTITDYTWTFGNGAVSTQSDPTYAYNTAGNFTVTLEVTDANGCSNNHYKTHYVKVSQTPNVNFTGVPTASCLLPQTVNFTNTSSSPNGLGLTYEWDFGDGSSSTNTSPNHSYTNYGNYPVKLTATDENGCTDSILKNNYINIVEVTASFTPNNDTVCPGTLVSFTNTSTGSTYYHWEFGDGTGTNSNSPTHTFNSPGTYTVTLQSWSADSSCTDTYSMNILVQNVVADFTYDISYSCESPTTVHFIDQSTGATSWSWNFGALGTSTQQNPSVTYVQNGVYDVTLTVNNGAGCSSTITIDSAVIINVPDANFIPDEIRGCIPLEVNFTDNSSSDEPIVSWLYDFGDGTTSNQQNPNHTFTPDGEYTVELTITNDAGCTATHSRTIVCGTKPQAGFFENTDTTCAFDPVQFNDTSMIDSLLDEWIWTFGDGGGSSLKDPMYQFVDTGYMSTSLIVGYNGCYDTVQMDSVLFVMGPIISFTDSFSCGSPFDYTFIADIKDANRWYWDIDGDGVYDDTTVYANDTSLFDTISYTYPATGSYTISLFAISDSCWDNNDSCSYIVSQNIQVTDIGAVMTVDTNYGCVPLMVNFDASTSPDAVDYRYVFGDGSTLDDFSQVAHNYTNRGDYYPYVVVYDIHGCIDTSAVQHIKLYQPDIYFSADTLRGCPVLDVQFTDTTKSDTTLNNWIWAFGDGDSAIVQNPAHSYPLIGNYTVTLNVTDVLGCSNTVSKNAYISVIKPIAQFSTSTSRQLCANDSVHFLNQSTGIYLTYLWDFGDGSTSTEQHPWHTYSDSGYYAVTLTAMDTLHGCDSTITKTDYIHVQDYPQINFAADTTFSVCYPLLVIFQDSTVSDYIDTWLWDFGDGNTSDFQIPGHSYTEPGLYDVSLIVTTTYGCTDTLIKQNYIDVNGPYANFSLNPDTICKGDTIFFTITDLQHVHTYEWDFGDGYVGNFNDSTVQHQYNMVGNLIPRLIYRDSANVCPQYAEDSIYIYEVIADFLTSDTIGCPPLSNVIFTNQSTGANSYYWNFDDGTFSTQYNETHDFNSIGTYQVQLVIQNAIGCIDTAFQTIEIFDAPPMTISNDMLICPGETAQLEANGGNAYLWTPATTLSDDTINNPIATPDTTTQYNVTVYFEYNCTNSDSVTVFVQNIPVVTISSDTNIVIGETVQLNVTSTQAGCTYHWSPSSGLSCIDCPNPIAQPMETTTYTVIITDSAGCTQQVVYVTIDVLEETTIDVPDAFTPNGDGTNDIIYANGWGIKNLLSFEIYNRWGEMVFKTNDINTGWDGTYKGVLQNIDSYAYIIKAETYKGTVITKTGTISLLK